MKERIVLASNINESEALRSLTKHGVNTMGLRIVNSIELAKLSLMRSGCAIKEKFLPRSEETFAIFPILKQTKPFGDSILDDAINIVNTVATINNLNSLVKLDTPIFDVINKYEKWQNENNIFNAEKLILKAVNEAKFINAEIFYLKENNITPLEIALLEKISNNNYKAVNFFELANLQNTNNNKTKFVKAYGSSSEISNTISTIYENKIPLDQCSIVCSNTKKYSQLIYDVCVQHDIDVTFSCGIPITNAYPAILLKLLNEWNSFGQHGIDSIRKIITSESFDKQKLKDTLEIKTLDQNQVEAICKIIGNLRISFDAKTNNERISNYEKLLQTQLLSAEKTKSRDSYWLKQSIQALNLVKKFAHEFEHGPLYFIDKYAVLRKNKYQKIDLAAKTKIFDSIKLFNSYFPKTSISEIIPNILQSTICHEISKEGALHISSITGAYSSIRKNIFICGMQANEFPGSPSENYLILDDELLKLTDAKYAPTSDKIISNKKKCFDDLINNAKTFGSNITASYAGNDLVELKEQNPSSVLFEVFESENPGSNIGDFSNEITNVEYFENKISSSNLIASEYAKNANINYEKPQAFSPSDEIYKIKESKKWTPSAIETFFRCPRQFYLKYLVGVQDISPDNPYEIINAMDTGNIAHKLMEILANSNISEQEFVDFATKLFDEHLITRPPIDEKDAARERQNFINIMKTAYKQDPHNKVVAIEKWIECTHSNGLKLGGFLDRLEIENNKHKIVDFKTKKKIEHVENDIDSCLQIALYALICEQNNIQIEEGEYRYLRFGTSVRFIYNSEIKQMLDEKINEFKQALDTDEYPCAQNADACRYCNLSSICQWEDNKQDE